LYPCKEGQDRRIHLKEGGERSGVWKKLKSTGIFIIIDDSSKGSDPNWCKVKLFLKVYNRT